MAGDATGFLRDEYKDSGVVPPYVSVFIKIRQARVPKNVPSTPNPFLDAIGVMDHALAKEPSERVSRWLMMQQMCRIVLAASNLKWDYTDRRVLDHLERRTRLLEGFLEGGRRLEKIRLIDLTTIDGKAITVETGHSHSHYLELAPEARRNILIKRLLENNGLPKNPDSDNDLMTTFALAHMWDSNSNHQIRTLVNAFCMVAASNLTGLETKEALNVLHYGGRALKTDFSRFGSKQEQIWKALIGAGYIEEKIEEDNNFKPMIVGEIQPWFYRKKDEFIEGFDPEQVGLTDEKKAQIFDILEQAHNRRIRVAVEKTENKIKSEDIEALFAGNITYSRLKDFRGDDWTPFRD
jgi:hypothetical protein